MLTKSTSKPIPYYEPEKEIRFAVVMYGGVSLAIYIYGVAKELYSLVRATAPNETEDDYLIPEIHLKGAEKTYRRLGHELKAKFVIDILSGTSAGGINAIYLAKALANGQSFDELKNIWLDQGDIAKLVNDKESEEGLSGLRVKDPPSSLLNSQRMYFHLLKTLHGMEKPGDSITLLNGLSPFVEELDLHITATDIRGLMVQLPVSNARVNELRFRNAFHFHYSTTDAAGSETGFDEKKGNQEYSNDFKKENNPFLAFAARCTSSFPFAFEPMRLDDVKSVLQTEEFREDYKYNTELWTHFYKDYQKAEDDFPQRSFGDGGYLDNKPFSYATENLLRRRADLPVDRKLIYIDPSPEHPEESSSSVEERPDVVENVLAALLSIPRYEPVREDLEKIIERNQLIARINHIIVEVDRVPRNKAVQPWQRNGALWAGKYLIGAKKDTRSEEGVIGYYGLSYATYHQLRVESVLEDLRIAMLRAFNWDETGKQADDLHSLIDGWRHSYYTVDANARNVSGSSRTRDSENDILFRLDMNWRMRRLSYMQKLVDTFLIALHARELNDDSAKESLQDANHLLKTSGVKLEITPHSPKKIGGVQKNADEVSKLKKIKVSLNDAYAHLRARGRKLRTQNLLAEAQEDFDVKATLNALKELKSKNKELHSQDQIDAMQSKFDLQVYITELKELKGFLEQVKVDPIDPRRTRLDLLAEQAREAEKSPSKIPDKDLEEVFSKLEEISEKLAGKLPNKERMGYICNGLRIASRKVNEALGKKDRLPPNEKSNILAGIRWCLWYYYTRFEYDDMLKFPILYGTNSDESDEVEIIRVSPEDANSLLDERMTGRKKLAGIALANFGAFFAREWRENDMMWGRLDGAECLLKALSVEGESVNTPIRKAQMYILEEELRPRSQSILYEFLGDKSQVERQKPGLETVKKPNLDPMYLPTLRNRLKYLRNLNSAFQEFVEKNASSAPDPLRKKLLSVLTDEMSQVEREINQEEKAGAYSKLLVKAYYSFARSIKDFPKKIKDALTGRLEVLKDNDVYRYNKVLRSVVGKKQLVEFFKNGYHIDREFPPQDTAKAASRATRVFGKLLDGLSGKYSEFANPAKWVTAAGSILAGILQITLPSSLGNYWFMSYLIWLLYALEILLIVAGWLLTIPEAKSVGGISLALTFGIHMGVILINAWLAQRFHLKRYRFLRTLLLVVVVAIVVFVVYFGLVSLGIAKLPEGTIGGWLQTLLRGCPKTAPADTYTCHPTK